MNLLKEGIAQKKVQKTTLTRKLTIDGITMAYPVYKVSLDVLFYNDKNDRIATWISKFKADNNGQAPDISNKEEFNRIIEEFIILSNTAALKRTKNNIELVGQREPGVVLSDGRIIDGNRRFTCLRQLSENNSNFEFFETVILDRDIENNAKQIKLMELSIQHGEESKVEYNAIDRIVGIYNDIVDSQLISVKEYAACTNESVVKVKSLVDTAYIMVDFLEYINAPKQFHIIRDMEIYAALEEILKVLKKCKTNAEKETLKKICFNNILMKRTGDFRKIIRNISSILDSDYREEFIMSQEELSYKIEEILPVNDVSANTLLSIKDSNRELATDFENTSDRLMLLMRKSETRNKPIENAEKATILLDSIDINIIGKMNDSEQRRMKHQLKLLEEKLNELKEVL